MAVCYKVIHLTRYAYGEQVPGSRHLAHLAPRATSWQRVRTHRLRISPQPAEQRAGTDWYGNDCSWFAYAGPHDYLEVEATSEVVVSTQAAAWRAAGPWDEAPAAQSPLDVEYRLASPAVPLLPEAAAFARPSFLAGRPLADALEDLAVRTRREFTYDPDATSTSSLLVDVLRSRRGVCQDFAHFLLSGLRGLGFTARYMSGYVAPLADGAAQTGAAASHAWVAVRAPDGSWIGCDPTNGKLADDEFVTLAWGRDFGDVTPLRGVIMARGAHQLQVAVSVERQAFPTSDTI